MSSIPTRNADTERVPTEMQIPNQSEKSIGQIVPTRCGLCGCEHDHFVNNHGDCRLCARAQYE